MYYDYFVEKLKKEYLEKPRKWFYKQVVHKLSRIQVNSYAIFFFYIYFTQMQMALWIPFINAILLHKNVLLTVEIDKYLWKSSNECDNLPVDIRNNWGGGYL